MNSTYVETEASFRVYKCRLYNVFHQSRTLVSLGLVTVSGSFIIAGAAEKGGGGGMCPTPIFLKL